MKKEQLYKLFELLDNDSPIDQFFIDINKVFLESDASVNDKIEMLSIMIFVGITHEAREMIGLSSKKGINDYLSLKIKKMLNKFIKGCGLIL